MRLAAIAAVLLFSAGSAFADCAMHQQSAKNDQTVAQDQAAKKVRQSHAETNG